MLSGWGRLPISGGKLVDKQLAPAKMEAQAFLAAGPLGLWGWEGREENAKGFGAHHRHRTRRVGREQVLGACCCDASGIPGQMSLPVLLEEQQEQSVQNPAEAACLCQPCNAVPALWALAGCLRSIVRCCPSYRLRGIYRLRMNVAPATRPSWKNPRDLLYFDYPEGDSVFFFFNYPEGDRH